MDDKIGLYLCSGCGIGDALEMDALIEAAEEDHSPAVSKIHKHLCGPEGLKQLRADIDAEELNKLVICGCSSRVCAEVFAFPELVYTDRVNLREHVAWSHEPKSEDTQELAEDYVRMGVVRAEKAKPIEAFDTEGFVKRLMVVGGGVAGLTAAKEASKAGYEVVLVEKSNRLGGNMVKYKSAYPRRAPFDQPQESPVPALINAVEQDDKIAVHLKTKINRITGAPGKFAVEVQNGGKPEELTIGAIIQATGMTPYPGERLAHLGYGKFPDVITSAELEEMARKGAIKRPSDGRTPQNVVFVQCAGSRDPEHLPYCSTTCCMTSLKQALYIREQNPDSVAKILYKDMRTPGRYEEYYQSVQEDPGVLLTKAEVTGVIDAGGGNLAVQTSSSLLGNDLQFEADLVVLAVGMQANVASEEEKILNLTYRQGPDLPELKYGMPDSHFICFPYETRRTGIYTTGAVRAPQDSVSCIEDARGAALKAVQACEMLSQGQAVHPRAMDLSFPDFFLQRCTQCKRCTEECPFGMLDEDEKGTPLINLTRCRRCGICMGACPERIIGFQNYNVDLVASTIRAIEIPDEEDEKPRVVAFLCENDAYPALDMAGIMRMKWSPYVRVIPVRCLGSVNTVWIADSLSNGMDGIMLIGCKKGDDYQCHMVTGSELAYRRMENVKEALDRLKLEPERVLLTELAVNEYHKLPELIDEFMETMEDVGPNPFKGF